MCFCLRYCAKHVKEMHMFGGCVLACQVSKVRVQAVWEDCELAREIRDGGGKDWSDLLGRKMKVLPAVWEELSHLKGSEHGEVREAADPVWERTVCLESLESKSHFQPGAGTLFLLTRNSVKANSGHSHMLSQFSTCFCKFTHHLSAVCSTNTPK